MKLNIDFSSAEIVLTLRLLKDEIGETPSGAIATRCQILIDKIWEDLGYD